MPCPKGHGLAVSDMHDAHLYARQGAKDMPNTRHALSLLAKTLRRLGQHGVWWHPYELSSGAGHLLD
jgi:hypothetical protein